MADNLFCIKDYGHTSIKGKRIAMRQLKQGSNVRYECLKSKAEIEIYLDKKHIKKLILE